MKALAELLSRALLSWMSARQLGTAAASAKAPSAHLDRLLTAPGKKFLHVGCGSARKPHVSAGLQTDEWSEIRLDIDPSAAPDIVASMLDMAVLPDASVDAVFSSHNIEHLYPFEVPVALAEFYRVLSADGLLILTCPDLQSLAHLIADDKLDQPAYVSPAGPIAPLDVLYGHRPQLAAGNLFMAHHTGFTLTTLTRAARAAGFRAVAGRQRANVFDLWIVAAKSPLLSEAAMQDLADLHLPQ